MRSVTPKVFAARVEHVGSLLRSTALREATYRFSGGEIDADALRRIQDDEIRHAIERQESVGLPIVTDGEFRRRRFEQGFTDSVTGVEVGRGRGRGRQLGWQGHEAGASVLADSVGVSTAVRERSTAAVERIRLVHNLLLDEFRFAQLVATHQVKVTLLGPDYVAQILDVAGGTSVYESFDELFDDVVSAQRQMITELIASGCRYVQVDAPGYRAYSAPAVIAAMRGRGDDPITIMERSIAAENSVIANFPDAVFALHVCRGRSDSADSGPIDLAFAERLFAQVAHDRLLIEIDLESPTRFEMLRAVPSDKTVVLGIVATMPGVSVSVDDLCRLVDEASEFVSLDRLAIGPRCGFESVVTGAALDEEEQWRRLEVLVAAAEQVWT